MKTIPILALIAAGISGVKNVINNMTIAPAVSDTGVKPAPVRSLRVVSVQN